jgi:hypothetical protein
MSFATIFDAVSCDGVDDVVAEALRALPENHTP